MNSNQLQTRMVRASDLHAGDHLVYAGRRSASAVTRITPCADGSIRVFTQCSETRMTGSILVRITAHH